jgi:DNA replicative helicase MCM subunit Mcm2 (Cdc46/Mcm family)
LKNVAALNELVQNQNVSIDYSVQSLSIPVDVPVLLVTAESKSLLQTEAVVYLEELHSHTGMFPFDSILNVQSQNASVHPIVGLLREYILHGRAMYPSISREVAEVIEQDLVMIRKDRPESDPILQMLNLVTLACLVACSYLSTELKVEHWRHAVQMDVLKNERIQKAKAEQLL